MATDSVVVHKETKNSDDAAPQRAIRVSTHGFLGDVAAHGSASSGAIIRATVVRWFGNASHIDAAAKQRELAERELYISALTRLYAASSKHAIDGTWRVVRPVDIEEAMPLLQRLTLVQKLSLDEVSAWCVARAGEDNNPFAHCIDPFQIRHLMAFHRNVAHAELGSEEIDCLKTACRAGDSTTLRTWFDAAGEGHASLPRDTPQRLRAVLFELWSEGASILEELAFEIAVLEMRMFDIIAWDNMRTFCSRLKRIGGSTSTLFNAYLSDEDIDEAMLLNEDLGNDDECRYYSRLAAAYRTDTLRNLQRTIVERVSPAAPTPVTVQAVPVEKSNSPFAARLLRTFGFGASSASAA